MQGPMYIFGAHAFSKSACHFKSFNTFMILLQENHSRIICQNIDAKVNTYEHDEPKVNANVYINLKLVQNLI